VKTNFYRFLLVYVLYNLASWGATAAFSLLVAKKFGTGSDLIISLVLRILPRLSAAPLLSSMVLKIGPKLTAGILLVGLAMGNLALPHVHTYGLFQGLNVCMGIINMGIIASLVTLRTQVLPTGKNVSANAMFATVERVSQIVAPALIGILLKFCSMLYCFYAIALLVSGTGLLVTTLQLQHTATSQIASPHIRPSYISFIRLLFSKPVLWMLFIPTLGYGVVLGSLNTFLLWSTTEIFHQLEEKWVLLLTAHSIGAIVGSVIAPRVIASVSEIRILNLYLWVRLCKLVWLIALAGITKFSYALGILAMAGIPESIGSVCFFTMIQTTLTNREEALYHSLSIPLFNLFVVLGICCSWSYTTHWLSLREFWLFIIFLAGLSVFSCLLLENRFKRIKAT